MVKRVVGLPGARVVAAAAGYLALNGSPTERRLADPDRGLWEECLSDRRCHSVLDHPPTEATAPGATVVADRHLYVLGDDRRGSIDSRHGWQVPFGDVLGRVERIAWSIDPAAGHMLRWLNQWRWSRTGLAVR